MFHLSTKRFIVRAPRSNRVDKDETNARTNSGIILYCKLEHGVFIASLHGRGFNRMFIRSDTPRDCLNLSFTGHVARMRIRDIDYRITLNHRSAKICPFRMYPPFRRARRVFCNAR